jgi:hypothetical protein
MSKVEQEATMQSFMGRLAAIMALLVLSAAMVRAVEEKEAKGGLDKTPKAVLEAVKAKFPNAKIVSASAEKDKDQVIYEVQIKDGNHKADVSVTAEGKIVSVEKEIETKDLPKAVTSALEAKYPNATIKRAEQVKEEGKPMFYEVLLVTADSKTLEVSFDPQGKLINEEKKEKKTEKTEKKSAK